MSDDCLFCKIISGEIQGDVVYQDDDVYAFRDINPQAPTHILIVPKRHIPSMNEAASGDAELLGKLLLAAARIAKDEGVSEDGYRLVINTNRGAGQSVFHIHVHLLGGRQMGWPPG